MGSNKSYSELIKLKTFKERYEYLRLRGKVCDETFGSSRYLNQAFYKSPEWKEIRSRVILRDNGCDLGMEGHEIQGKVYVHHINPITPEDVIKRTEKLFDLDNLISTSFETSQAIHYGNGSMLPIEFKERFINDTCPWRNGNE